MATRPAYVWTGSDWDEIGDSRLGPSVTALNNELASKLNIAGGKILQIVRATDSTNRSTTSTSFVDTGLSVTITPQKSDSSVLIIASFRFETSWGTGDVGAGQVQITDSSNNGISGAQNHFIGTVNLTGTGTRNVREALTLIARDTPATTSATTYKLRFRSDTADVTTGIANGSATGQLYAIEVSA